MKRLLVAIGIGIALAATAAHAQEGPAPSAPATSQKEAGARPEVASHSTTVHRRPHRHPFKTRGKHAGDPPVIDHSMDTLVVEPTRSTIIIVTPTPP